MSFLDAILHKVVQIAGVSFTERKYWNFVSGVTAVDNATTGATDLYVDGGGAPLANASTGTLNDVATTSSGAVVPSVRFSGAAPTVTGLASGVTGRRIRLIATGGNLILRDQNASSSVANRIITGTGANVTIANGTGVDLEYDGTTSRWRLIGDGAGGASSVPTGTGVRKIVAGVEDAAASLILNADVDPAAAIAASKVVQATGTGIPHVVAGVLTAASSLIVNADVNAAAGINCTKTDGDFGSTNVVTTGAVCAGSTPRASTGTFRCTYLSTWIVRNSTNGSDTTCMASISPDALHMWGTAAAYGNAKLLIGVSASWSIESASVFSAAFSATNVRVGVPIVGHTGQSSPYSVHGAVVSGMTDAAYSVPATEYSCRLIDVTSATTLTAGRAFKLPTPATEAGSYDVDVINNSTGGFVLQIGRADGAGVTVNLTNTKRATYKLRPAGAYLQSAEV